MSAYLLLRDNKKSGPHSFEEMRVLGLLPHDLIWVEGRSVRWSHPSELAEFKGFSAQIAASLQRPVAKPGNVSASHIRFPVYDLPEWSEAYLPTLARHGVFIDMGLGIGSCSTTQKPERGRHGKSLFQAIPESVGTEDLDHPYRPQLSNSHGTSSSVSFSTLDIRRKKSSKSVRKSRKKHPHHLDLSEWLSGTDRHDGAPGLDVVFEGGFHIEFSF